MKFKQIILGYINDLFQPYPPEWNRKYQSHMWFIWWLLKVIDMLCLWILISSESTYVVKDLTTWHKLILSESCSLSESNSNFQDVILYKKCYIWDHVICSNNNNSYHIWNINIGYNVQKICNIKFDCIIVYIHYLIGYVNNVMSLRRTFGKNSFMNQIRSKLNYYFRPGCWKWDPETWKEIGDTKSVYLKSYQLICILLTLFQLQTH